MTFHTCPSCGDCEAEACLRDGHIACDMCGHGIVQCKAGCPDPTHNAMWRR